MDQARIRSGPLDPQGRRSGPSDLTGTRSESLDLTGGRSGPHEGGPDGWISEGEVQWLGFRRGVKVRGRDSARGRSGPLIQAKGRSGPSDPDKGRSRREGFRREVGTDGEDSQMGDPMVIKCLGGQDRSGGSPDGQG